MWPRAIFVPAKSSFSGRGLREARGERVDVGVREYLYAVLAQRRRRHAGAGKPPARKTPVVNETASARRTTGTALRLTGQPSIGHPAGVDRPSTSDGSIDFTLAVETRQPS